MGHVPDVVPLYDVRWVSHAEEQFYSLPAPVRRAVMDKVARLQTAPTSLGVYDPKRDTYTTDFEYGFIVYGVVEEQLKIIMLRLSAVE